MEIRMVNKCFVCFVCLLLFVLPLSAQNSANPEILSVKINPENLKKLKGMNLDLLMERDGKIYIVADYEDRDRLYTNCISFSVETQNFYPFSQSFFSTQGGVNGDFHTYTELERDLLALEDSFPELARVYDIGDSLENRNIYAIKISDNVQSDENEAEVLFLGCHHAREWISVEVPYLIAKYLLENYDSNTTIRDRINRSEIWIVPLVNPDGLEYSIYFYRYWRKNRRDNGDGSYGVDLNRNYGYEWGYDNEGSSPNPESDVYRGTSAFSEPETRAIRDFCAQHSFLTLVSYHNYSQIILYPWGYKFEPSSQDALMDEMARTMSERMLAVNGRNYDYGRASDSLYTTNGDTTDWSFGIYGIPSFTIELPPSSALRGQFFNAEEDIEPIFNENLQAALYLIDWAIQNKPAPPDRLDGISKKTAEHTTTTRPQKK